MSTIQVSRPAAEPTRKFGQYDRDFAPSTQTNDHSTSSNDAEMMYAWSIGITSAARAYREMPPPREEDCPPEVYIG